MKRAIFALLVPHFLYVLPAYAGPLAWWTFDETGTPTTAADASGNGNAGSAAGVTGSPDVPAALAHSTGAFSFNGSNAYVVDGDLGFSGTDPFSVSLWFKPTVPADLDGLITKRSPGDLSAVDWQFWWNAGDKAYTWQTRLAGGANTFDSNNTGIYPRGNAWHHLAIVRDGAACAICLDATNGVAAWSQSAGQADINSGHSICVGNLAPGMPYGFNGLVDDVAIWNRALTDSEVAQLAGGAPPAEPVPPPPPPEPPAGPVSVNVNFGGTTYTGVGAASDTGTVWTTTYAPDPAGRYPDNPDMRSLQGSGGWPTCMALDHNYPVGRVGTYGSPAIPLFSSYIHNYSNSSMLTLSGLHSARAYNLYFYGARDGLNEILSVTVGGVTSNMVTGGNTSTFVEGQNYVRFGGVAPDRHGEIQVNLGGGPSTVNLLCGLQIEEVDPICVLQSLPKRDFVRRLRNGENLVFAFLGTSLTGGGYRWVDVFGEWLGEEFPGQTTLHNYGWGATGSGAPTHLPYGLRRLHLAIDANPDVVFIEFATNDAHTPFATSLTQSHVNMEGIVNELLHGHPAREVVLMTMNPTTTPDPSRPKLNEYFDVFRDLADERQLLVIDHFWNWQKILDEDPVYYASLLEDTIHPSLNGYRVVHKPECQRSLLGENQWGSPYAGTGSRTLFLWHLDRAELDGANLPSSVAAADMVLTSNLLLVPGRFNEGVCPNGSDPAGRAVSAAAGEAMETGEGAPLGADPSLTVECWFRIGQLGFEQVLLSKRDDPSGGTPHVGLSIWLGSDNHLKASWGLGDQRVVLSADTLGLTTGQAYHVAMVWDGDVETARLFVDGAEKATQQVAGDAVLSLGDQPLVLANSATLPWKPLQGVIDEVRVTVKGDPFTASAVHTASYSDWAWANIGLAAIRAGDAEKGADADGDGDPNAREQLFAVRYVPASLVPRPRCVAGHLRRPPEPALSGAAFSAQYPTGLA